MSKKTSSARAAALVAERKRNRVKIYEGKGRYYLYAADAPRHGTRYTYTGWGCQCPPCREANTAYFARYCGRTTAAA